MNKNSNMCMKTFKREQQLRKTPDKGLYSSLVKNSLEHTRTSVGNLWKKLVLALLAPGCPGCGGGVAAPSWLPPLAQSSDSDRTGGVEVDQGGKDVQVCFQQWSDPA